eukprot:TRINITY_DN8963_c0_g1_i1.p1 TRINITY_DN8963_c0_g1~~TRINITY_DN8963_c0_g1_i1.p1  ORF type:complete len:399 (+),score=82.06 TRINITY_DN8963_c0_g1_i1:298-1494(+)
MLACANGRLKLVLMLEKFIFVNGKLSDQHDFNLNEQDRNGNTALHHSLSHYYKYYKSVENSPLNPFMNSTEGRENTPTILRIRQSKQKEENRLKEHDEIAYILTRLGASLEILNSSGKSPLMLCKNEYFRSLLEFTFKHKNLLPKKLSVLILKVKRFESDSQSSKSSPISSPFSSGSGDETFPLSSTLEPEELRNLIEKVENYTALFKTFENAEVQRTQSVDVKLSWAKPMMTKMKTIGSFATPQRLRQSPLLTEEVHNFSLRRQSSALNQLRSSRTPLPATKNENVMVEKKPKKKPKKKMDQLEQKEEEIGKDGRGLGERNEVMDGEGESGKEEQAIVSINETSGLDYKMKEEVPNILQSETERVVVEGKKLLINPYFWLYIVALLVAIYFGLDNVS